MKFLRKLNRGLILTILVLIGVAAYLITLAVIHGTDKVELQSLVSDYIAAQNGAFILEEDALGDASFDEDGALSSIKATLSPFFAEEGASALEETARTTLYQQEQQYELGQSIEKAESRIQKIEDCVFAGKYAEITVTFALIYDGPGELFGKLARETDTFSSEGRFSFVCMKENGAWKLISTGGYESITTWSADDYRTDISYMYARTVKEGGAFDGSVA